MEKRVQTGIAGFDEMIGGGFLPKHNILVTGGPGSGKTTLCMEFLYNGAEKYNEKGLFVSLEEKQDNLVENLKQGMNWDFKKHIDRGSLKIVTIDDYNWEHLADVLQAHITRHGVKRVVIDTLTLLKMNTKDEFEFRRNFIGLMSFLENLDCTTLITAESGTMTRESANYSLEEFIVDGVLVLYNLPVKNQRRRAIEVLKMRGVKHSNQLFPFKITEDGIVVYQEEIL
jgi:KaiC/GvpD/RAD55 family RecA-like ATPase